MNARTRNGRRSPRRPRTTSAIAGTRRRAGPNCRWSIRPMARRSRRSRAAMLPISMPRCARRGRPRRCVGQAVSRGERPRLLARLGLAIIDHARRAGADRGARLRQAAEAGARRRRRLRALLRVLRRRVATSCTATTIAYPEGYTVLTWREPHGVTGHIIPWNYPLQIFGRSVGGALAAGNACVVKPAEDACLSLLRIAELAAEVGLPRGRDQHRHRPRAARRAPRWPSIRASQHMSFTGSPATGVGVAAAAAKRHCPVTLELGGKSPQVVFADADLDAALAGARQRDRAERRPDLFARAAACWSSSRATRKCWRASASVSRRCVPAPRSPISIAVR